VAPLIEVSEEKEVSEVNANFETLPIRSTF